MPKTLLISHRPSLSLSCISPLSLSCISPFSLSCISHLSFYLASHLSLYLIYLISLSILHLSSLSISLHLSHVCSSITTVEPQNCQIFYLNSQMRFSLSLTIHCCSFILYYNCFPNMRNSKCLKSGQVLFLDNREPSWYRPGTI